MFFLTLLLFLSIIGVGVFTSLTIEPKVNFKIPQFAGFVLAAILTAYGLSGFVKIDAGNVGVVKHFGNPAGELQAGLHYINPITATVTPIAVQSRIIKLSEEAGSKDLQEVTVEVTLRYHVDPAEATYTLVKLNNDAEKRVVLPSIQESIKAVTAKYDAEELLKKRAEVKDNIETDITAKLAKEHLIADQTAITSFSFSHDYNMAIEAKVTALQKTEQALNGLQRIKTEADQKVATANGDARAKIANAKGEAEALAIQRNQITPELLQLRTVEMLQKVRDGKLPSTVISGNGQNPIPFLDVLKAAGK